MDRQHGIGHEAPRSLALALQRHAPVGQAKGDVALVSVISSSDPALTVVAARVVLEERISQHQAAGVALALTGLLAVAAA